MAEHRATITWERSTDDFQYDTYDRNHRWAFENGAEIAASAAPDFLGDSACIDPEEAFVASLSSCHMLTFLAIAAKKRLKLDSYTDAAVGYLQKNEEGKLAMTEVILRPQVKFSGEKQPTPEQIEKMHHTAHENCFIALSVKTEVRVECPVS